MRQLSLFRVLLETNSQNRALLEIFPRGCFFCTYPTWEAPVELATSCMSDKWQALDESADMAGDFTLQVAIPVSALTAAGSGSSSSVRQQQQQCRASHRCRETPLPLAFPASWRRCFHWRVVLLFNPFGLQIVACVFEFAEWYCVKRESLVGVFLAWLVLFACVPPFF